MSDPLEFTASEPVELEATPSGKHMVPSWMVFAIAVIAIVLFATISGYILENSPTEGERASIQKAAELFATSAFFYFLGSSAGSRNKDAM